MNTLGVLLFMFVVLAILFDLSKSETLGLFILVVLAIVGGVAGLAVFG
jgi:hypothetical protein